MWSGPFQMVRAVAPRMQEQGRGGHCQTFSSLSGMSGSGSSIAYAASKAALNTMTLSLARALAPEIRVNAVCPGVMQTRWWREGLGEERYTSFIEQYAESAPLKSAGTPEAVADPVVWLLEGADQITGEDHHRRLGHATWAALPADKTRPIPHRIPQWSPATASAGHTPAICIAPENDVGFYGRAKVWPTPKMSPPLFAAAPVPGILTGSPAPDCLNAWT